MFGSILLLFVPVFSRGFYLIYLLCGLSDMIDGTIARKTNTAGKFGSRLDTVADLIFVAASLFKLLPIQKLKPSPWPKSSKYVCTFTL